MRYLTHPLTCGVLALVAAALSYVSGVRSHYGCPDGSLLWPWLAAVGMMVFAFVWQVIAREGTRAVVIALIAVAAFWGSSLAAVTGYTTASPPSTATTCSVQLPEDRGQIAFVVTDTHTFLDPLEYSMRVIPAGRPAVEVPLSQLFDAHEIAVPVFVGWWGQQPQVHFAARGEPYYVDLRGGRRSTHGFARGAYLGAFRRGADEIEVRFEPADGAERPVGLMDASGLAAAPDGTIYVGDSSFRRVHRYDPDGALIATWDLPDPKPDDPSGIQYALTVDRDGTVYVSDTRYRTITRYDAKGRQLASWGDQDWPNSLAVDRDGRLYVGNSGGPLEIYSREGKLLSREDLPTAPDATATSSAMVADDGHGVIYVGNASADTVGRRGANGMREAPFATAAMDDLAVDAAGRVYVVDANGQVVYQYSQKGQLTRQWGLPASGQSLHSPACSLAVDRDHHLYVTNQDRVFKYDSIGRLLATFGAPVAYVASPTPPLTPFQK